MWNWAIDGFTPSLKPGIMTPIEPDKPTAIVQTYGGVSYFAWPAVMTGKIIENKWTWMNGSDYAAIRAKYVADNVVLFDPDDGSGRTFMVNIVSFYGAYLKGTDATAASIRTDVNLQLLVMSEVA